MIVEQWRERFFATVSQAEYAGPMREAALAGRLGAWTTVLTAVVVQTCLAVGWQAAAKGHRLDLLPLPRDEYLTLDVMAFAGGEKRWRFPVAAIELENSQSDDRIAYSLWKVLCVPADLRLVFCYRRQPETAADLVRFLGTEVVGALGLERRTALSGETLIVIGRYSSAGTFPNDFFRWWRLDNTGSFRRM